MFDLPFEIFVEIAEKSLTVWYLLSISYKKFGTYSIQPLVKSAAQKRFLKERILYVPLCRWNYPFQLMQLPIPSVSLQFHEIKILTRMNPHF